MVKVPDSPSSPVRSAAIPTTTNRAYELTKQGGVWESRHEYEMVGAPPATYSPAGNPVEGVYETPSLPSVYHPLQVLPASDQ